MVSDLTKRIVTQTLNQALQAIRDDDPERAHDLVGDAIYVVGGKPVYEEYGDQGPRAA